MKYWIVISVIFAGCNLQRGKGIFNKESERIPIDMTVEEYKNKQFLKRQTERRKQRLRLRSYLTKSNTSELLVYGYIREFERLFKNDIDKNIRNLIQNFFTGRVDDIGNLDIDQLKEYFEKLEKRLDNGDLKQFTISFQHKDKSYECKSYMENVVKKIYGINNKEPFYNPDIFEYLNLDFKNKKFYYQDYVLFNSESKLYYNIKIHDFIWKDFSPQKIYDDSFLHSLKPGDFLLITLNNDYKIVRKLYRFCRFELHSMNPKLVFDANKDEVMLLSYVKSIYKIK